MCFQTTDYLFIQLKKVYKPELKIHSGMSTEAQSIEALGFTLQIS